MHGFEHLTAINRRISMPRNRTRAQRAATGRVSVEVQLLPEQKAAMMLEATRTGRSVSALVAELANSLLHKYNRRTVGKATNNQ
jgi:hypothetical protein